MWYWSRDSTALLLTAAEDSVDQEHKSTLQVGESIVWGKSEITAGGRDRTQKRMWLDRVEKQELAWAPAIQEPTQNIIQAQVADAICHMARYACIFGFGTHTRTAACQNQPMLPSETFPSHCDLSNANKAVIHSFTVPDKQKTLPTSVGEDLTFPNTSQPVPGALRLQLY